MCVRGQARDPMSGNPLYSVQMVRNAPLAKEISEWLEARPGVEVTLAEMAHDRFMQVRVACVSHVRATVMPHTHTCTCTCKLAIAHLAVGVARRSWR